jgi:hypothetical protein
MAAYGWGRREFVGVSPLSFSAFSSSFWLTAGPTFMVWWSIMEK